ncbi:6307_t:CDS:2, partial [Entrophospora sp. SA101]
MTVETSNELKLPQSGDLRENQYNAQFISPILENTLKTICNIDWRILEVPVESSKDRCNANINPIVDKVLEAKCADGLACLWRSREEVFLYEQTGPPDFDDITQLHIHDYKLVRTMRDVLNQLIILRFKDGIYDHKDLASFSAFGHRTEVSLFWLTIHQKSYCLREYGTFKIPAIWQDIPILCEAIITCLKFFVSITKFCPFIHCFLLTPVYAQSFMKENIEKRSPYIEQKQKIIQRAWRNYKNRPESLATQVWNALKTDDYPNDKKFLGITPQKVNRPSGYDYIDYKSKRLSWHSNSPKLWAESKKSLLTYRLYDYVVNLLQQNGYRLIGGRS